MSRLDQYVERPGTIAMLDALIRGGLPAPVPNALLVSGPSGSGKTSLLAYWSALRYGHGSPGFCVAHYVGLSGFGTDHAGFIRRTILAIRDRFQIHEEPPGTRDALEEEFPRWLGFVQSENLVLIIDGLDHLDARARDLTWLPEYIQRHVRLIASTRDEDQADILRSRGYVELHVAPLSHHDRLAIVGRYVQGHRARLNDRQVRRVASAPASANPLFLRSSLEEVRAPGRGARVDERIEYYLQADGLEDLYLRILVRLETEFDPTLARDVLCLVAASRSGLTSAELAALTGRAEDVGRLVRRLDFYLLERHGLLSLLHHELRRAVGLRYLESDAAALDYHHRLADFFEPSTDTRRRADELPWHLLRCGELPRLASVLNDVLLFHELYRHDAGLELMGYALELGAQCDLPRELASSFAARFAQYDREVAVVIGTELGAFLRLVGCFVTAVETLNLVLGEIGDDEVRAEERGRALMEIGRALREAGDLAESELRLRAALSVFESLPEPPFEQLIRCRCALGELLSARADKAGSRRVYHDAVRLAEERFGASHAMTAEVLVDLGPIELEDGHVEAAESSLRRALGIFERAYGPDHPSTTQVLNNLAHVVSTQGRAADAIALIERALDANRRVLGPASRDVAVNHSNLGMLRRHEGDTDGAAREYALALDIFRRFSDGRDRADIATTLYNVGQLELERGRFAAAEAAMNEAQELFESALGESHPASLTVLGGRVSVARARGDVALAEELARRRLSIIESLHGAHSDQAREAASGIDGDSN